MQSGDGWVVFTQKVAFKLMGTQRGWYFLASFKFIHLAGLGLHCCSGSHSSSAEWGLLSRCGARGLLTAVRGLLTAVPSLCALLQSSGSRVHELSCCDSRALEQRLRSCGAQA